MTKGKSVPIMLSQRRKSIKSTNTVKTELTNTSEKRPPVYNDHHFEVLIIALINLGPKGGRCTQV